MQSPLHVAVEKENMEIIQLLLLHKGINLSIKDQIVIDI